MATSNTMKIELTELKSKAKVTGRRSIPAPLIEKRNLGLRSRLIVLLAIATVCLVLHTSAAAQGKPQKTVVLVHGAFADGSSWDKVIPLLQAKGLQVVAVQNPLTSLADDVAATKRVIDAQSGPVILVGHSWGGTVITEAGNHAKVAALVYVAAFVPDAGQSSNDLGKDSPPPPGLASIRPDSAGFLYLTPEGVAKDFAQDLPAAQTAVMAVTQGPIFGKAFDEKVTNAAWKSKPSWYIVAEKDRMIQPDLERAMAKKINAKTTVLPTSHVPMLSRPREVATVILAAAGAVKAIAERHLNITPREQLVVHEETLPDTAEQRLKELGIKLPVPLAPVVFQQSGNSSKELSTVSAASMSW